MSSYSDKFHNQHRGREAGQRKSTSRSGPPRPTRYFHRESTKDRNGSGERPGHTGNSSPQSRELNRNVTPNYTPSSNFDQSPIAQPAENMAVDQNVDNTIGDVTMLNLHPTIKQEFSPDESCSNVNNVANAASSSNSATGGLCNNNEGHAPRGALPANKKDVVKLNGLCVRKLVSQEGVDFLQKLSDETKVKIKVLPQGQNKKFEYVCVLEGPKHAKITVKRSIKTYCQGLLKDAKLVEAEPFDLLEAFRGEEFNMKVLQESLLKLENPNVNWVKLTVALHKRVKETWGKFNAATRNVQTAKVAELADLLKSQYTAFHAVLFGKLDIADGPLHLSVLKLALKNGIAKESDAEVVQNSYNYIFRSPGRLQIDYASATRNLPPHVSLKTDIDDHLKAGIAICEKNNMNAELCKLKAAYSNLIHCHYSERKIFQFRRLYDGIQENS